MAVPRVQRWEQLQELEAADPAVPVPASAPVLVLAGGQRLVPGWGRVLGQLLEHLAARSKAQR